MRTYAWTGITLLLVGTLAMADGLSTVRTMGGLGVGARALGLGGAYTAVADGPAALYWNPAALALEQDFKSDFSITGAAKNLDALGDLKDVYDAIDSGDIGPGDFSALWDAAERASGRPVTGAVGGLMGFSYRQFAIGGYGQAAGDMLLEQGQGGVGADAVAPAAFDPTQSAWVTGNADGLGYYAVAVGYGRMVTADLAAGVAIKRVHVVRAAAEVAAQYDAGSLTYASNTQTATSAGDDGFAADLGIIWWPQPEKTDRRVRVAAVVRNIGSPRFDVDVPIDDLDRVTFGTTVNVGVGVTSKDGRTLFTADVHNVLSGSGADATLAAGVEHQFTRWLALRAGWREGHLTAGLTLQAGPFALVAAAGTPWGETAAFSFDTQF